MMTPVAARLTVLLVFAGLILLPAQRSLDSLRRQLSVVQADTEKINLCIRIANVTADTNEATRLLREAMTLAQKTGYRKGLAKACSVAGINAYDLGNFAAAVYWHTEALRTWTALGDQEKMAQSYLHLALLDSRFGNEQHAIENLQHAIALNRKRSNEDGLRQDYFEITKSYKNLGLYDSALYYSRQACRVAGHAGYSCASMYHEMAAVFITMKQADSAALYIAKADAAYREANTGFGILWDDVLRGELWMLQDKAGEAVPLLENVYVIAKNQSDLQLLYTVIPVLLRCYHATGAFEKGFRLQEEWDQLQDSLSSSSMADRALGIQLQLEAEQKDKIDSLQRAQNEAMHEVRESRQRMATYAVGSILVLALGLAVFIYRGYREKKKTNEIIFGQKKMVEEKQKEILDSITYAKRLQTAILPPLKRLKDTFPDCFVTYLQKDIVAGDFYFFETTPTHVFIAAADCTGHGVPGAMVSMVCSNALTRAVKEFGLEDPGKVLDKVRALVMETFEKSEDEVKDGMDISLLVMDRNLRAIRWAGANNPLWYCTGGQMHEIKADKQPVGAMENARPFTTHNVPLHTGSIFYLFTDGFADQFGGPKGKKFRYKQLEEILVTIFALPMEEQQRRLEIAFHEWKGELEQVDDVCVIALRV